MSTRRRATAEGTARYADTMARARGRSTQHYRDADGLRVSSIGIGTYLGDADDETDVLYTESVIEAVREGCNVVDSAINYRFQRSERAVGEALDRLFRAGDFEREQLVVCTKGGYVPFDGEPPRGAAGVRDYVRATYVDTGVCSPDDFATNGQHCMAPGFLAHELDRSLANLRLDCVDVYYIHNPEGQLGEVPRETFDARVRAAFELLETKVVEGKIARYGTATWGGYRAQPNAREYLALGRLLELAREVGGDGHHFRVVQLPYSLAMPEAYAFANQAAEDDWVTLLAAAERFGVSVFASAPLMQSRLAASSPPEVAAALGPGRNAALTALQFARSTPGIASALVGMRRPAHVRENLALASVEPAAPGVIADLFEEE